MSRSAAHHPEHADVVLLSCEHGGNAVPPDYAHLFRDAGEALTTHRGYDIGALGVAMRIASTLACPIVFSTTTRLLIDLNRSLDSPSLFSEFSRVLPEDERGRVVDRFYAPYRRNITQLVSSLIQSGRRVVHVGIHSFTDMWEGRRREIDLALLFDEARPSEASFCERWQLAMQAGSDGLRHRFNEPYRGSDDGLTTELRGRFTPDRYLGLEVEVRQGLLGNEAAQSEFGDLLVRGLAQAVSGS